jgi:polyol transport system permease protein
MTATTTYRSSMAPASHGSSHRPGLRARPSHGGTRRGPLLPALFFMIVVTQVPFLVTLYLSLIHWNGLRPGEQRFAGLENYAIVLADVRLRAALVNTVVLTASVVLLSTLLGLCLAMLLDQDFRGRGIVRTLLISPFLIMPMAGTLLWKHAIYNPTYGLVHLVTGTSVDWVSDYPMAAVVVPLVWQWTPFMMLIILAGLHSQNPAMLEAARTDGAGRWQTFILVKLPVVRPYLELSAILGAVYVVQTFDAVFTITQGGPGMATTNLPYEIYLTTFRKFEYGEASASGVLVVFGTIAATILALRALSSLFRMEGRR